MKQKKSAAEYAAEESRAHREWIKNAPEWVKTLWAKEKKIGGLRRKTAAERGEYNRIVAELTAWAFPFGRSRKLHGAANEE